MSSGLSLIVDSSVWIEHFSGTEKGKIIQKCVENKQSLATTAICFAEVITKVAREGFDTEEVERKMQEGSIILPVDVQLARIAGRMYPSLKKKKPKISLSDVMSIAAARQLQAKVLTYDSDFYGLDETAIM